MQLKSAREGFFLAGLYNFISILGFTQFFTDTTLMDNDPIVFSWLGQILILLWGLAYWSVAKRFWQVPVLLWIFCVGKLVYFSTWLHWLLTTPEKLDVLAGQSMVYFCFFASYGFGDFLFAIFFARVAMGSMKGKFEI